MTSKERELAIDIFEDNFTVIDTHGHYTEEEECLAIDMAIKALEQEPILDKVRAEIVEMRSKQNVGVLECLDIIDKYRGEVDCRECKAEYECYYCKKYAESELKHG